MRAAAFALIPTFSQDREKEPEEDYFQKGLLAGTKKGRRGAIP
jgi:hypothetical protein